MTHINIQEKNNLIRETLSKKVSDINLRCKNLREGTRKKYIFIITGRKKGKIFYTKT